MFFFYFTLKAHFQDILVFVLNFCACIKAAWLEILPNISRSKDNQTIKFGQLIEYKIKNIFVEISYTKSTGETIPRRLSENSKLAISLDQ